MTFLDSIEANNREIIISLPYRVGLWISQSDSVGGDVADEEELKALENIINGFTQEVFGSEVVQHVMTATWNRKEEWKEWGDNLESIPAQCQIAIDALNDAPDIEDKEVSAYKLRLVEIAEAVALAFREYDDQGFFTKIKIYIGYYFARYKAKKENRPFKTLDQYLNISLKERQTLKKLAGALGTVYV